MANVSPSPTVSMLRVTRVSRCSFLFSLSMATVSWSSGEGFNTLPPHSTYKTGPKKKRSTCWAASGIKMSWVEFLHCRQRWSPLSSTGEETSRSNCHSSPCRHRWRRNQTFQPRHQTRDHLKQKMEKRRFCIRQSDWFVKLLLERKGLAAF